MTRQEFIDNVETWDELKDFCYDVNCDYCDEVYSADSRDDCINEDLADMARNADSWQELLGQLQDIETGWDYYIHGDYGVWSGTEDGDDIFGDYKDDVLEWMDNNDYWDEDDEEEEVEEEPAPDDEDPEDEEPVEEEDVSIAELFTTCNSKLQKIDADTEAAARAAEEEAEEAFNDFCAEVGVTVTVEIKGGNA